MRLETKTRTETRYGCGDTTDGGGPYSYKVTYTKYLLHPESALEKSNLFDRYVAAQQEIKPIVEAYALQIGVVVERFKKEVAQVEYDEQWHLYRTKPRLARLFSWSPTLRIPTKTQYSERLEKKLKALDEITELPTAFELFYTPIHRHIYQNIINYKAILEPLLVPVTFKNMTWQYDNDWRTDRIVVGL